MTSVPVKVKCKCSADAIEHNLDDFLSKDAAFARCEKHLQRVEHIHIPMPRLPEVIAGADGVPVQCPLPSTPQFRVVDHALQMSVTYVDMLRSTEVHYFLDPCAGVDGVVVVDRYTSSPGMNANAPPHFVSLSTRCHLCGQPVVGNSMWVAATSLGVV